VTTTEDLAEGRATAPWLTIRTVCDDFAAAGSIRRVTWHEAARYGSTNALSRVTTTSAPISMPRAIRAPSTTAFGSITAVP
jgi:hypothetical protein